MQDAVIATLPVAQLFPHPNNAERAKRYDQAKLKELAESIKANGLAQPVLVSRFMSVPGGDNTYTIVAGERRWQAHKLAGLDTITAVVRDLTPQQQLELQIIENLQREDVHPLQEADGYAELIDKHGIKVEQLAERVGKSRAYVFARLKLRDLKDKARAAFYDGKFGSEIALLLARIPVEKMQDEALKAVTEPRWEGAPATSYREAKDIIERGWMLQLKDAPFDPKDATLYPDAGACGPCPKRTGNQGELFADVKGKDICTDTLCFGKKRAAHFDRMAADAKAAGIKVIEGAEAKRVVQEKHGYTEIAGGYVDVDKAAYNLVPNGKAPAQVLGKALPTTALVRTKDGDLIRVAEEKEVRQALVDKGMLSSMRETKRSPAEIKAERDARLEKAARLEVFRRVREKIAAKPSAADLQMVAHGFFQDIWDEARKVVYRVWVPEEERAKVKDSRDEANRYGSHNEAMHKRIDKMDATELAVFVCDCALAVHVHVNQYSPKKDSNPLFDAAARHKVDVDAIRKELRDADADKLKAKKDKKAKAKGKAK